MLPMGYQIVQFISIASDEYYLNYFYYGEKGYMQHVKDSLTWLF